MGEFLWVASTGWIAALLFAVTAALPFLLRLAKTAGRARATSMRVHYLLGFAIPGLALLHSGATMARIGTSDALGIWLASLALAALFLQMSIGNGLRAGFFSARWAHFAVMLIAAGLIGGHVWLNRV